MKTILKFLLSLALVTGAQAQTAVAVHAADYGNINAAPVTPGDVVGPASSTNNAFARWSGTTGKLLQDTSDLTYSTPTLTTGATSLGINLTGTTGVTSMNLNDSAGVWQRGSLVVSTAVSAGVHAVNYRNAAGGAAYLTNAMAEGTQGSPTTLGTGVVTGGYLGYAYANADFREITRIASITSDTFSDSDWSAELRFYTHNTSATGGATLRATLNKWGKLSLAPGAGSQTAWTTTGALSSHAGATITDSSTAVSGTAASAVFHSWAQPTLAATNATVTTTDAATLYIAAAPANGTNNTITNPYAIWVDAGNVRLDGNSWTAGEVQTGTTQALAARINYNLAAYGTGTVYTLTNTAAAVAFGTTSPSVTIDKAGTYLIQGRIQLAYTGATVVAETATAKLRRTNNTAADLTSGSTTIDLPVATTLTYTYGTVQIPPVVYTTTNTNDVVTIFANVSATLGVGTITAEVGGTNIIAIRLY